MLKHKKSIFIGVLLVVGLFLFVKREQSTPEPLPINPDYNNSALIDEKEILSGGVRKDGIPSIDNPKFTSISDAVNLTDDNMGVSVTVGKDSRFYPYRILVFHEIVNDTIGKKPLVVTYCPLCGTGIVFDPVVNGNRLEFGVSGKLWQSNLLMYDRTTDSLWSQVLGQAVVGPLVGTQLTLEASDIVSFGAFKKAHPKGRVLSEDTGAFRRYGHDPYGSYYSSKKVIFPVRARDDRLHEKDMVLGVIIEGQPKAYSLESLQARGEVKDVIEGVSLSLVWNNESEEVVITRADTGQRVVPFPGFWFSWLAAHPDTLLYK